MIEYMVDFLGIYILGIGTGVLLCLRFHASSQRRREREESRRQLQRETESLRCDFESLRSEVNQMLQRRPVSL